MQPEEKKKAYIVLNKSNSNIDCMVSKIESDKDYEGLFISTGKLLKNKQKDFAGYCGYTNPAYKAPDLIKYTEQIVVIDHHRRGVDYLQNAVLTYQETYASSTCELVTEILQYVEEKIKLAPIEAEALYAGIVVDTKTSLLRQELGHLKQLHFEKTGCGYRYG